VRQDVLCRIACLIVMYDTECLLRLLSFASSMYLDVVGLCSADPNRLIRCYGVVSNRMSDRYVRYRMFVTIIEFCVIYVFWTLSICVQQIGMG
jgi:hypothetical protein